jgi:uncharacterized protein
MNLAILLALPILGALTVSCAAAPPPPSHRHLPTADEVFAAVGAKDTSRLEALLAVRPELAGASSSDGRSAIIAALFTLDDNGETFLRAQDNGLLRALLARRPTLDAFDAAAAGDPARLGGLLDEDERRARAFHVVLGTTPLHIAAFAGRVEAVELLLRRGAEIDTITRNRFHTTPLVLALLTEQEDTARLLVGRGADLRVPEDGGRTALHVAASAGNLALVGLLLDHGADPRAKADDGSTPGALARKRGHAETAALLERRGGA